MADLARMARPWLLSLRPPVRAPAPAAVSPYLGLGYSRGISATTASRGRVPEVRVSKATRAATKTDKKSAAKRLKEKDAQAHAMAAFLLPFTIVPPPIWRFPRSPSKFAQMVWLLARNRAVALGFLVGVYFLSMGRKGLGFGWPRFRAGRKASIPAAKALHAQMSEAAAAGDRDTLRRICSAELFQTLAGAIDSRPRHTRTEWELVRYDGPLRYPRVADFRVMYQPAGAGGGMRVLKQAVVSISSVQRLTRYYDDDDANGNGGQKVPGGERERHMMEHLVLQAVVEDGTFETGPWKIWGTLPEMSFETIRDDHILYTGAIAQDQKKVRR
ncbi:hypothetical protein F5B21DRAFT_477376 [Xylaria acuta]|nr:hypothetical protein F5B21DRAFT_477376 [Xylaria acuta]